MFLARLRGKKAQINNGNGLNCPVERHNIAEWIEKNKA